MNEKNAPIAFDFDAKQFANTYGFFLHFIYRLDTQTIHHTEGYFPNQTNEMLNKLSDFEFYSSIHPPAIETFLQNFGAIKAKTKVQFALYNATTDTNIIHNIYLNPDSPKEAQFHLCFVPQTGEAFRETVIVSVWKKAEEEFQIKTVHNTLNGNIALQHGEYETLRFWMQGYSSNDIARLLKFSPHTINDYKKSLYETFNTDSIYQLMRYARKENFI